MNRPEQQPPRPPHPPQAGAPHPGQPGFPHPGQPGFPRPGQPGFPRPGQPGLSHPGQPGFTHPGQPGHPVPHHVHQQPGATTGSRVPKPRLPASDADSAGLYAPGVPRADGRYDLTELDHLRAQRVAGTPGPRGLKPWLRALRRSVIISFGCAVFLLVLVWGYGNQIFVDNHNETIETAEIGIFCLILILVCGWVYPVMLYDPKVPNAGTTAERRGIFSVLGSAVHAALLTVSTLLWPLLVDFPTHTGNLVDNWGAAPDALGLVFMMSWVSSLSAIGGFHLLVHMLSRPLIGLGIGLPWFIGGIGFSVYCCLILTDRTSADIGIHGPIILIIALIILVATVLVVAFVREPEDASARILAKHMQKHQQRNQQQRNHQQRGGR